MIDVKLYYENNIEILKKELKRLESILISFAVIRMIIVIFTLGFIYYFYNKNSVISIVWAFIIGLLSFIVVAFIHNEWLIKKQRVDLTLNYNEKGLKRINGQWREFEDKGDEFVDINHKFTSDLDVFGDNSLFQWINTTNTEFGRKALSEKLMLNELPSRENVRKTQEAIKELAEKRDFATALYVDSCDEKKDKGDINELLEWAKTKSKPSKTVEYTPYLFIVTTFIIFFLYGTERLPITGVLLMLLINFLVVKLLTRNLSDVVPLFMKNKKKIIKYSNLLGLMEDCDFNSEMLIALKRSSLRSGSSYKTEMKKLKNIISWIGDSKSNAFYFIINVIFLSDVFILKNLERWRIKNGELLEKWLIHMGEIEALVSLSNLAFENNTWIYPTITNNKEINGLDIGHPMLRDKAVVNDFALGAIKDVALITGSNMSGKSTFLRTVGFNMILAYLGLPTYSKEFKCGIFNIYTCMRTQDNLEESISSFYAEILRIKLLIQASKRGEDVFFLLDEIFKGTNSVDRHVGAKVLIQQLVNGGAKGMVSTHDLELCDLEREKDWLINFNFQEYYEESKIKFDYKLRNGKSKTQNAKHLMKLAGIEIS